MGEKIKRTVSCIFSIVSMIDFLFMTIIIVLNFEFTDNKLSC